VADPKVSSYLRKKTTVLSLESDLPVDLTFHGVSASLIAEFAENIVKPYYRGNLNAAIQDLIQKALADQAFVLSRITHIRTEKETLNTHG
jgi:hypothetical protein